MNRSEFEAKLALLLDDARHADNVACVSCERCSACAECTFCKDGRGLIRCQYCVGCEECTECANCTRCTGCVQCTRCVESERCTKSAYVVQSTGCSGCNYCFGCVGLHGRDFHILNEPYDRETYFRLTRELSRELRLEGVV